ncbi:NAD-dependent epimerase/dehydratase family protein [Polynucleobacter sphagniphilus]|jgi:nucleoside-diphosphate-sugar epimerase|uniref:Nucleoside-diphosphate-sugar epimerase n=1 Tax=Polynucleobacter sphagniphilus TaxID=1743169 RepID=A0AA43MAL5_9BURK|nr:NAD-dependent epimerase/dehydratase family protein [Polynucleobacter sphagniphilus]MDH6504710.1 nucleoside-diphosphate-sugar epimerase [Polynucleobacter sphagniphilus]MDH6513444.1 nucleoside-diphosphate-sugar epimerase [Polynucleobacter sphagniphilus]
MDIVVIGGSGFIGTSLCKRFFQRHNCSFEIIDKSKSIIFADKTKVIDVRFPFDLDPKNNTYAVINLAAEHRDDVTPRSLYSEVNVQGAINICNAARKVSLKRIIFTSSVAVYGFAPTGTDEFGEIVPFNDYGKTKWEAEQVYKEWQAEDSQNRTLVIIRPTVVFGEGNRGNVFNLLKQISSGKFLMVGDGLNRKSMAYVENVTAFLEYSLDFNPGVHIYNYIDKPDFTMNTLVAHVNMLLGRSTEIKFRLPFFLGLFIGTSFDLIAKMTGKKFSISKIRVKKFCANSVYESAIESTGFIPPVPLMDAIEKTVRFEFIEDHKNEQVFYSE